MKNVSIIIPVYNQLSMTMKCLQGIVGTAGVDLEIIVVDDGSNPPVKPDICRRFPQVRVMRNDINSGFAKTINRGIRAATHDFILLLNNDVIIKSPDWLVRMVDSLVNRQLHMTAPAGGRMDKNWNYLRGEAKKAEDNFTYLSGWCLLVRRQVFERIGLIPEDFGKGFFEDVLFSYRAKEAGFALGITEAPGIRHLYHATFKAEGYDLAKEYLAKRQIFLDIIGFEEKPAKEGR